MCEFLNIYFPEADYLLPYLRRELGASEGGRPVMISSTDIYVPSPGDVLAEGAALRSDSLWARLEASFLAQHPDGVVLRAAPVVATGMTGDVRKLAEDVYRGIFFHLPGNDARMSVVHAVDVARVAALASQAGALPSGRTVIMNITDGVDPRIDDLAEALAYRFDNKRISTLSTRPQQIIGRWLYGKRVERYTLSRRFDGSALVTALGYEPTDVCRYLRTHVYDHESL